MRDDDTLDDPYAAHGIADRSDDTPSSDQLSALHEAVASRPSLRTRIANLPNLHRSGRTRAAVATGLACCLGLAVAAQVRAEADEAPPVRTEVAQRAEQEPASRGMARDMLLPPVAKPTASADPDVSPTPSKTPAKKTAVKKAAVKKPTTRPKPTRPAPVAGLDRAQMDNAIAIVKTSREMGMPRQAAVIAVATAMQESNLYNYASGVLPESQNYPHQAIGWDHDSVGLFQQRPSSGWGEVGQLMDPEFATRAFLTALQEIPGWQDMELTLAAQAVQVSAFPWAYAQHEWRATEVVEAILG